MKLKLMIFVIFGILLVILTKLIATLPDENACKEYSFNDKVYITGGFYKGQTGAVTAVEWLKFSTCNRTYVILLDTPSVEARVKVNEMRQQDSK